MLCPKRAAKPGIARSGMRAVTTGRSALPVTFTEDRSAGPNSKPMSDGLIGVACIWISTSSGPGTGTGVGSRLICKVPSGCASERSCSAVEGIDGVDGIMSASG
jgi:hypothetical protein